MKGNRNGIGDRRAHAALEGAGIKWRDSRVTTYGTVPTSSGHRLHAVDFRASGQ